MLDSFWRRWREFIADLFRPLYESEFSRELWDSAGEIPGFTRGAMMRSANLSVSQNMRFGIFAVIGLKYAHRAARTTMPRELLLMEEISFAFNGVWRRASEGRQVPSIHVERTVQTLSNYFEYLGEDRDPGDIRKMVEEYIREEQRDYHDAKESS